MNGTPPQAVADKFSGQSYPPARNGCDQTLENLRIVELKSQLHMGRVRTEDRNLQIATHDFTFLGLSR